MNITISANFLHAIAAGQIRRAEERAALA